MIYAMSDIHGFLGVFRENLGRIDLSGNNRLVLLGDYIDYGPESGQVVRCVYRLQQRYGAQKVIALRGNHEQAFLDWIDAYGQAGARAPDEYGLLPWSDWLTADTDYRTFRTLITPEQWETFAKLDLSAEKRNIQAAGMVLASFGRLIRWMRQLPYYYETERQIFVHAGVDEEAGELWRFGTPDDVFTGKFPAAVGPFYKDIVAGHIGAAGLAGDPAFHGVYHDGASHYYIDGTVNVSGSIPILAFDEGKEQYFVI